MRLRTMPTCRHLKSATRLSRTPFRFPDRLTHHIEEVPAGAVLDFDNPKIGVKLGLPRQILFDFQVGRGLRRKACGEDAIRSARLKRALRCGSKQLGRPIQPADAHENRTGLFGTAPPHDSRTTFDLAAPQIGRNPQGTFEAHCLRRSSGVSTTPKLLIVHDFISARVPYPHPYPQGKPPALTGPGAFSFMHACVRVCVQKKKTPGVEVPGLLLGASERRDLNRHGCGRASTW